MHPGAFDTAAAVRAAEDELTASCDALIVADRLLAMASAVRLRGVHRLVVAARADDDARRAHEAARGGGARVHPRSVEAVNVLERSIRLEVSAALRVSAGMADQLVRAAGLMIDRFPVVIEAMDAGRLGEAQASVLVDVVADLDDECADEVLERALPLAETLPPGKLRRRVTAMADRLRDEPLAVRHARALEDRRVAVEHCDDGMSWIHILTATVNAVAIETRLAATAKAMRRTNADETRTALQLRSDAAVDLLVDGDTDHLPEQARGIRAEVTVTVPVLSLLTGDDAHHGVAELHGAGPIPLGTARRLAGSATEWVRVLTHPVTGIVLDVDRTRYRPPADLKRLVRWMHGTCTAPGCTVSAGRCELDHIQDWQHGGPTSLTNLHPVCKGHHTIKHATRWTASADTGPPALEHPRFTGRVQWTSPAGTVTTSHPEHELAPPF